jgi:FAR1 DNA-binding domain
VRTIHTLILFTEMASSTSPNEQQQLYIGQYFFTWDSAIDYVQKWCNTQGFQTRLNRSKRNAAGEYQKLTIICQHAGKSRNPLTELQTNKEKSKEKINRSIQMGCKAHINLSRPERDNVNQYVYVTTIFNDHCHELNCQLVDYENEVKMTEEMLKDIEFLTKHVHLSTTQQRIYFEEKYPEQKI